MVDPETGPQQLDLLEDEREFDTTEIERRVTAPDSNRKILEELKKYADEHEQRYGRFPKTLIFAANDLPHTSPRRPARRHRPRRLRPRRRLRPARSPGRVDRPLQRIREFRNRPEPGDRRHGRPALDRRRHPRPRVHRLPAAGEVAASSSSRCSAAARARASSSRTSSHFTVFDCFDGTLLEYFRKTTGITADPPDRAGADDRTRSSRTSGANRDRDYNIRCLVKRLQRIDKEMTGEARETVRRLHPRRRPRPLRRASCRGARAQTSPATMTLLRDRGLPGRSCVHYPRPAARLRQRHRVPGHGRRPSWLIRDGRRPGATSPRTTSPPSPASSARTRTEIEAIRILLDRPRDWSTDALTELRQKLAAARRALHRRQPPAGPRAALQEGARRHHLDGQARRPRARSRC